MVYHLDLINSLLNSSIVVNLNSNINYSEYLLQEISEIHLLIQIFRKIFRKTFMESFCYMELIPWRTMSEYFA